ncbi:hypothetical protein [Myxosarcina sp. GI1]|uniref:hypothetical protein n=1 Tax=Myxosarcina sp. GI1 TaxID=1541065 RepID=UPI0005675B5D|nr:hypothetical protein [Myxosarcina sp. GI1]
MSQELSSDRLQSTWGQFSTRQAAETAKQKLESVGIPSEQISLETENQKLPPRLQDTQALDNAKSGAIVGGVLGAFVGLTLSLILAGFPQVGFAAFKNFDALNFFAPLMGAVVGAVGISLISALGGSDVPQSDSISNLPDTADKETEIYLVTVKGTSTEMERVNAIIHQEGGLIGEENRR